MTDFSSVTLANVTLDFGRRRALGHVSCSFAAGEIVAVLGPNGAGKTTLLLVAATLLDPASGTVRFDQRAPAEWGAPLRGRIGLVGHDLYVYPDLSAADNLRFFARLYRVADVQAAVAGALREAGLDGREAEPVAAYSRGMRQRLAIERALIHDPRLVLLDEPFTGLDEASADALKERLRRLRERGRIIVVTTHDVEALERLADRVLLLKAGRLAPLAGGAGTLRERYRLQSAR